jgi:hypothetical protein
VFREAGKLTRGALWMVFPPAGAVASVRAGQRKDTQRIVDAIERAGRPAPAAAEPTPGGFRRIRHANGTSTVIVPRAALKLHRAWTAGNIRGLTLDELSERVGGPDSDAVAHAQGCTYTWSRRGYTVTVLFGHDGRAASISHEQLG